MNWVFSFFFPFFYCILSKWKYALLQSARPKLSGLTGELTGRCFVVCRSCVDTVDGFYFEKPLLRLSELLFLEMGNGMHEATEEPPSAAGLHHSMFPSQLRSPEMQLFPAF